MNRMVALWRIGSDTPETSADALTGQEAEQTGGRWSEKGTPLIYACTSIALACLESTAHLPEGQAPSNRFLVRINVPASVWRKRQRFDPVWYIGWDAMPPGQTSVRWGMRWVESGASALAAVPSVIVPEETNVLINPLHEDAGLIKARKLRRWNYDLRLC